MFEPPLPREAACHWCEHPGHILLCDVDDCLCAYGGMRLGVDTALCEPGVGE